MAQPRRPGARNAAAFPAKRDRAERIAKRPAPVAGGAGPMLTMPERVLGTRAISAASHALLEETT